MALEQRVAGLVKSLFRRLEEIICITAMIFLALLPAAEVVTRLIFKTGIPASSGLMVHLLLAAGLFSGMICSRKNEHLSIGLVQYLVGVEHHPAVRGRSGRIENNGSKLKDFLKIWTCLFSACVAAVIACSSLSFISVYLDGAIIGFIPDRVFGAIIPLAFGVISIRFGLLSKLSGWKAIFPVLAILLGVMFSFPGIAKFIWGFDMPDAAFRICEIMRILAVYGRIPLLVLFGLAALTGTPLFVVMGGLAIMLLFAAGGETDSVAADIYTSLTNNNIIAIPLFTLVGFFLSESKAGERLVRTFRSFFSWMPGGIILATVIICAFFTSFTGASGVTILALGGILYTILTSHVKYPEKLSIGLLTSVGSIGLLFPPSLPIILVGATTNTNIFHLFLGGIWPGLILVGAVIIIGVVFSMRIKIPVEKFEGRAALKALKESLPEILLPVFLITGYFTGILSLVEIGAAALIYVFIVEVLERRDIALKDIPGVFIKAIPIIGGVLSILALSSALSYYIVDTQAPANLVKWMQAAISSRFVFLLLLNLTLLVVGCLMDIFSAILIVLPLIVPLGRAYGIDPVHLGIIFITNLEVGFLTPPVGLNLFLASYRFDRPLVDVCRYVLPFLLIQLAVVFLVTYMPVLSTYLPGLFR